MTMEMKPVRVIVRTDAGVEREAWVIPTNDDPEADWVEVPDPHLPALRC